ncbi:MAG: hypothetical protein JSV91_10600 [Phycisphaerales bacterium]|nr:MAG: hypothetical protein JSV91_10600 [Phycisphaerales bacterium]
MSSKSNISRAIAPEDIRPGAYVTILHVIDEFLPQILCGDDASWRSVQPLRVRWLPSGEHSPMKVKSVCLPFVFVKMPGGKHRSLDVRQHQLAEVSDEYARRVFRAARGKRRRRRRRENTRESKS